eukprot:TRINITY_DN17677_c0_g1_i1.p1 TRINITY_DN17677_c0_g1~~TRINITY_DN17677_c0_g1_i1.p1  ORF type:complete len:1402 (+),score=426.42 TRINITY_DN17677_c0_g1_i1:604-4206(+)
MVVVHKAQLLTVSDLRDASGGVPAWVTGVAIGGDERDIAITTSEGISRRYLLRRAVTAPNVRTQASCSTHLYKEKLDYVSYPTVTMLTTCTTHCQEHSRCTGYQQSSDGCVVWLGGVCSSAASEGFVIFTTQAYTQGAPTLKYMNYTEPTMFGDAVEMVDPCRRGDVCPNTDALFRPRTAMSHLTAATASRADDAAADVLNAGTTGLQYTPTPTNGGVLYGYVLRPPFDIRDREASARVDAVTAFAAGQRSDLLVTAHTTVTADQGVPVKLGRLESNQGRLEVRHLDADKLPLGHALAATPIRRGAGALEDDANDAAENSTSSVYATEPPTPPPVPAVPRGENPWVCRVAKPCEDGCKAGVQWSYDDPDRCRRLAMDASTRSQLQAYYGVTTSIFHCQVEQAAEPKLYPDESKGEASRTMPEWLVCLPDRSTTIDEGEACVDRESRVDKSEWCRNSACEVNAQPEVAACTSYKELGGNVWVPGSVTTVAKLHYTRVKLAASSGMELLSVYTKTPGAHPLLRLYGVDGVMHPRTVAPPATLPCAQDTSSMVSEVHHCWDGMSCRGTGCCDGHFGVMRCPPEKPLLCASREECGGDSFCCLTECVTNRPEVPCASEENERGFVIIYGSAAGKNSPCPSGYLPVVDDSVNGLCWHATMQLGISHTHYANVDDENLPGCFARVDESGIRQVRHNTAAPHRNYPNPLVNDAAQHALAICRPTDFIVLGAAQSTYPSCTDVRLFELFAGSHGSSLCRKAAEEREATTRSMTYSDDGAVYARFMGQLRGHEADVAPGCYAVQLSRTATTESGTHLVPFWAYYYVATPADLVAGDAGTEGGGDVVDALAAYYPDQAFRVCARKGETVNPPTPPPYTPSPAGDRPRHHGMLRCPWYCIVTCVVVLLGGCLAIGVIFLKLRRQPRRVAQRPKGPPPPSADLAARARRAYVKLLKTYLMSVDPNLTVDACSVCLDDLTEDVIELPACGHRLHLSCMVEYIEITFKNPKRLLKMRCPNCRAPVDLTQGWDRDSVYAVSEGGGDRDDDLEADLNATTYLEEAARAAAGEGEGNFEDDARVGSSSDNPLTASQTRARAGTAAPGIGGGADVATGNRLSRARTFRDAIAHASASVFHGRHGRDTPPVASASFDARLNSPLLGSESQHNFDVAAAALPSHARSPPDVADSSNLNVEMERLEDVGDTSEVGFVQMLN